MEKIDLRRLRAGYHQGGAVSGTEEKNKHPSPSIFLNHDNDKDKKYETNNNNGVLHHIYDSIILEETYRFLTLGGGKKESFCYLTGIVIDNNTIIGTKIIKLALSSKTAAYCKPDQMALHRSFQFLDRHRHTPVLTCHLHPWNSIPHPSSIDLNTHKDLEAVYRKVIGVVVSRDKIFNFFSYERKFTVEIYGGSFEQYDPRNYKLI